MNKFRIWLDDFRHLSAFYVCFCILLVLLGIMNFVILIAIMERYLG